jgi:hypothetical protein
LGVRGRTRLSKQFDLRRHVRIAADPVSRVFACQNPDIVIRLGQLRVTYNSLWLVADKPLNTNLSRDHVLGSFFGGPCDRTGTLARERRASEDKKKQQHEMSIRSHGLPFS